MAEELWQTLLRFHREVIAPDLRQMVGEELDLKLEPFKRDVNQHFDQLYKRLDTIESEIQSLRAAVKRLETDVAALKRNSEEEAAARAEFRHELDQIKAQIAELQEKVSQIEAQLNPPTSTPA